MYIFEVYIINKSHMTLTSLFEHTFHNFSKAPQQKGLLLHHPKHKVFESLQTEIDIPKIV